MVRLVTPDLTLTVIVYSLVALILFLAMLLALAHSCLLITSM